MSYYHVGNNLIKQLNASNNFHEVADWLKSALGSDDSEETATLLNETKQFFSNWFRTQVMNKQSAMKKFVLRNFKFEILDKYIVVHILQFVGTYADLEPTLLVSKRFNNIILQPKNRCFPRQEIFVILDDYSGLRWISLDGCIPCTQGQKEMVMYGEENILRFRRIQLLESEEKPLNHPGFHKIASQCKEVILEKEFTDVLGYNYSIDCLKHSQKNLRRVGGEMLLLRGLSIDSLPELEKIDVHGNGEELRILEDEDIDIEVARRIHDVVVDEFRIDGESWFLSKCSNLRSLTLSKPKVNPVFSGTESIRFPETLESLLITDITWAPPLRKRTLLELIGLQGSQRFVSIDLSQNFSTLKCLGIFEIDLSKKNDPFDFDEWIDLLCQCHQLEELRIHLKVETCECEIDEIEECFCHLMGRMTGLRAGDIQMCKAYLNAFQGILSDNELRKRLKKKTKKLEMPRIKTVEVVVEGLSDVHRANAMKALSGFCERLSIFEKRCFREVKANISA